MEPYIGITGFKTREEVEAINDLSSDANIMFGFLSSKKRLENPHNGGKRSPAVNELKELVTATQGWPVIHYFTQTREGLADEVQKVLDKSECTAVQINQDWPLEKEVDRIHEKGNRVILQIPRHAQSSIRETAERVRDYEGIVDYVLIDPSGGLGIPFDLGYAVANMHAVQESLPNAGIGIAGGFSPENTYEKIKDIQKVFPEEFSIDIETRVRSEDNKKILIPRAIAYVNEAVRGFR